MDVGQLNVSATINTTGVKQGADKVVNDLHRVDAAAEKTQKHIAGIGNTALTRQIRDVGTLAAGYFALAPAVMNFTRESVKSYLESETASKTLLASLKGNQEAYKTLSAAASDLQTKTMFSDEQIMGAQSMFGFMGKNADEIQKLIPLVINLGAAQEKTGNGQANLTQIAKILARTTGEELGPRLEMLIGPLTANEKAMLKNADGMDRINLLSDIMQKKFGDIGFVVDDTASQMKILANQVDEFKEGFGKGMVDQINLGIRALQEIRGANESAGLSFSDLGYAISKGLMGPITNVIDALSWLANKYSDTLNSIQTGVVSFMQSLQSNPVLKFMLPGLSTLDLNGFLPEQVKGNNVNGVVGTGNGDRANMFNSDLVKKKKGPGTGNSGEKTDQEQLTFLEDFRKKIADLEAQELSLTEQLNQQNLALYEQVALVGELESIQKRLQEMKSGGLDVSGKMGDLEGLNMMVKGLKNGAPGITPVTVGGDKDTAGKAGQNAGMSLEQMMGVAKNIHDILNQPLDNPFKIMQAMLSIAMQIGSLLQGGGAAGAAGGALSFLGPIGMGIGLVSSIFSGIFGAPRGGSSAGQSVMGGNTENWMKMARTFSQTGQIYDVGAAGVMPAMAGAGGGMEFYFNGRKIDKSMKKEFTTEGIMLKDFKGRKRSNEL